MVARLGTVCVMCGRARLESDVSEIKIRFAIPPTAPTPNIQRRWNLAPMQDTAIVHLDAEGRRMVDVARWSLLPAWSKDPKPRYATFNARDIDEKGVPIDRKPAFRDAFREHRCLVPLDAFYEWRKLGKADKQPFAIALASGEIMAVAGLWEVWRGANAETVRSFTIVTTAANAVMAQLHDRMPVILPPEAWPRWLGEVPASADELKRLLAPCPDGALRLWPIDKRVGNVRNEGPEFVQPVAEVD